MRMSEPLVQRTCAACAAGAAPCPKCEEEEEEEVRKEPPGIHRKAHHDQTDRAESSVPDEFLSNLGFGQPLDQATRAYMEPRFGRSFDQVRVHTDSRAAQSAQQIGALAYTFGTHIAFGPGTYAPHGSSGKQLIAHELTHTLQQSGSTRQIRRAGDFDIRGVNPNASAISNMIFFDMGSTSIPPSEAGKIPTLAAPPTRSLTLNGFTSEEGSAASNLAIINGRIGAVKTALAGAGHTGPRIAHPLPTAGEGQLDYRSVRAVEVVPTPVAGPPPSSVPSCQVTVANPNPQNVPCGANFGTAHTTATNMLSHAVTEVSGPTAAATTQLTNLFPGVAPADVLTGLNGLTTQIGIMLANHQCHNTCDAGCNRPGFNSGSGATAMMTLCPAFINGMAAPDDSALLLHEARHATPGLTTVDTAYRSSRMIRNLTGAQAKNNTDSYILLILRLNSLATGGPATDVAAGMSAPEQDQMKQALAFLEQWLLTAEFDTSLLYEGVKHNIGRAGGWDPVNNFEAGLQHAIGWLLGLTDPGMAAPFAIPPTRADQIKAAGIYDRYHRLRQAMWVTAISSNKIAAGVDSWAPNLGPSITVTQPFFALAIGDQVLSLLKLMLASMSDVPAALRSPYAAAANQIRWHRGGIGP